MSGKLGSGKKISRSSGSVIIAYRWANPNVWTIVSGISPTVRKKDVRSRRVE